jgi:hypothetical protein
LLLGLHISYEVFPIRSEFVGSCRLHHLLLHRELEFLSWSYLSHWSVIVFVIVYEAHRLLFWWPLREDGSRCEYDLVVACEILEGLPMRLFDSKHLPPPLEHYHVLFPHSWKQGWVLQHLLLEELLLIMLGLQSICLSLIGFTPT